MQYKTNKDFPARAPGAFGHCSQGCRVGLLGVCAGLHSVTPEGLFQPRRFWDCTSGCSLGLFFWNSNNQTLKPDMRDYSSLKSKCSLKWLSIKSVLQHPWTGMFSKAFFSNTVTMTRFTQNFPAIFSVKSAQTERKMF